MDDDPEAFGPSDAHYIPQGPAVWLKKTYPGAVSHAAMIYLNAPATIEVATAEMQAYEQVGFHYIYTVEVSPTEPNYAPYVAAMQNKGVQYVTEISDDNSASRLVQAMAQANFQPQVVDWFSEEYTQHFLEESQGDANGDLVLMETAAWEEASSNPEFSLYESWLDRVAPGTQHDIFGPYAWSAGLAFLSSSQGRRCTSHPCRADSAAPADRPVDRGRTGATDDELRTEDRHTVLCLLQDLGEQLREGLPVGARFLRLHLRRPLQALRVRITCASAPNRKTRATRT